MADRSIPDTHAPRAELLARIAAELVRARCDTCPEPPFLLAIPASEAADPSGMPGIEVEILELGDHPDPVSVLCHQRAKREWVAAGVMVDGWTVPPEVASVDWRTLTPSTPLSQHPARRAVRTLHLVSRGGAVALAMLGHDDARLPEVNATDDGSERGGPCGALPDSLRRLFGLPTPPSAVSALELWASLWLQALVASPRPPTRWRDAAEVHPASALIRGGVACTPDALIAAGRNLAHIKDWDALQLMAVTGGRPWSIMPPSDVAAWADAGMFARLVLRHVTPLWASRHKLARRMPRRVLTLVDDVLAEWRLPTVHSAGWAEP